MLKHYLIAFLISMVPVVELRGATARGIQLTTKAIARISSTKGSWWEEGEGSSKGVLL